VIPEPLRVTLAVARALERMGIPYFVGGSLASSAHGVARATLDADIVARLEPGQAERLVQELGPEFESTVAGAASSSWRSGLCEALQHRIHQPVLRAFG
jgi:hypothetical protein